VVIVKKLLMNGGSPAICRSAKKRKTLEQLGDLTIVTDRLEKDEKRIIKKNPAVA
jgi:hypothetical protein